ncbi:hypothetical protein [Mastigocoleus sp. MO_188.B34]|uniref:hypothetical protein n=1 Tax=Mastigocoleus sp. MO_188.B34 TaxID=3036635 RepID=UPI0026147FCF|nr:hypothetical protein [Mastigocoleus sp. MO_188.B34]MDJ0696737.1 hypothetical protein [Mastigocoleus sp. MO_188.B34]
MSDILDRRLCLFKLTIKNQLSMSYITIIAIIHCVLVAVLAFLGWYKLWLELSILCSLVLIQSAILVQALSEIFQALEETKDGTLGKQIGGFAGGGFGTFLGGPMLTPVFGFLGEEVGNLFDDRSEERNFLRSNYSDSINDYFVSIIINFLLAVVATTFLI